jgi:two-component system, OmpR family, sensor histidine kinase KdpD
MIRVPIRPTGTDDVFGGLGGSVGPRRMIAGYIMAVVGTAALVIAFAPSRAHLEPLTEGFAFLLLVVATVAVGGLGPGIAASVLGFVAFNYFFLPPYHTFRIARGEHAVVLFVFLMLSIWIAILIGRARSRARAAEDRARELALQQELADALVAPRPIPESYVVVLQVLVSTFTCRSAILYGQSHDEGGGLEVIASADRRQPEGEVALGAEPGVRERFPLSVGLQNLGLLQLERDDGLTATQRRIVVAFCSQLALLLERDRLLAAVSRQRALADPSTPSSVTG